MAEPQAVERLTQDEWDTVSTGMDLVDIHYDDTGETTRAKAALRAWEKLRVARKAGLI